VITAYDSNNKNILILFLSYNSRL